MAQDIVRGITLINPELHIAIADYRRQVDETEGVHVIEMANGIAKHLDNRIAVFGRWISHEELARRQTLYAQDPALYATEHIKSLSS